MISPEGHIDEFPCSILDALVAAHEYCLESLPLWCHRLLKDGKLQTFHRLHHRLNAFDDKVNTLHTPKSAPANTVVHFPAKKENKG